MKQRRNLFYEVKRPHRGKALVIGNGSSIQRDDGKGVLDTPLVADACYRDAEKMAEVLGNLGYDVAVKRNVVNIYSLVNRFSEMDHSEYDSFVFYFSGHGEENVIKTADSESYKIEDIVDKFEPSNCKTLIGKPKIFFWDCCRGPQMEFLHKGPGESQPQEEPPPCKSDFIFGYAAPYGFRAFVGEDGKTDGMSIYTYNLARCIALNNEYKYHLQDLLTIVQKLVQEHEEVIKRSAANNVSHLRGFVKFHVDPEA
eukprot:TRINITY_DN447_c0_g1_i5.p1 TRINITY_DN447_c0_g1~~TRINITY_DN447_c0_g1_i5.p1  ORF type:complete len:255 (+),score=47.98 TRINITY_DN447_c0_g1_i5:479-1243(+)